MGHTNKVRIGFITTLFTEAVVNKQNIKKRWKSRNNRHIHNEYSFREKAYVMPIFKWESWRYYILTSLIVFLEENRTQAFKSYLKTFHKVYK